MSRKRSLLSLLVTAAGFALAVRRQGQRNRSATEALRPPTAQMRDRPSFKHPGERDQSDDLGRGARSPLEVTPRGWWQVAKRTGRKFSENELMAEAAGVTFYALLSLFPAITAIVSIYGLFADRANIASQMAAVSSILPGGGVEIIRDQVHRLTQSPPGGLGAGAIIGLLAALWSANAGTKAMFSALNDVYGEHESRGFLKVTLVSLLFTLGGILFLLFAISLTVLIPKLFAMVGLAGAYSLAAAFAGWPIAATALVAALAVLYRYGPSRALARWHWVSWGGVIGAAAWIALSFGFSWYVAHFGSYNKTYGSLGAVIGFMTWIWLSTTVLLVGAQINAELEAQTSQDSTVGRPHPIGSRGAAAADTIS